MILELSAKERFSKIVEILAEGTLNLIKYKARLSSTMRKTMQAYLRKVIQMTSKDKVIKSQTIGGSFAEVNIEKNKQRRYVEPVGKIYSFSQTITRE